MPRPRWRSSKRCTPRKTSRMISSVQRSPTISSALAIEQTWLSYVRLSTEAAYQGCMTKPTLLFLRRMKQLTASPRRVLLVVSAAVFMASLDLFIVNIAFPDIQADLGGSDSTLSWVLNAYAIVLAALLVPFGRIADIVGRKRTFLGGMVIFGFASALCAAAPSVPLLVAARILQAIGAAMLMPTSLALLLSATPVEKRTAYVGAWAAVGGVAAAAGPPIGGLLVQLSWRWGFIVNLPIAVVALVAGLRVLREERDPQASRLPDLPGALLFTAAIAALTAGIVEAPSWGWTSPRVLGLLLGSVALLAALAWRSSRPPVPGVR